MQAHLEKLEAEGRLPTGSRTESTSALAERSTRVARRDRRRTGKAIRPRGRGVRGAGGDHRCRALVPALSPAASEDQGAPAAGRARAARSRSAATAGGFPTSAPRPGTTCGSARAFATARIASGSSTSTGGSAPGGWPRSPVAAGLQTDRFMRTLGLRRAAEREAAALEPELRSALDAFCAGVNAAAADRPLPAEFQLLRIGFEPFVPADSLTLAKLLVLRPLDQLGARAPASRDGPRAGRRAGGAAGPGLSARQPGDPHPGRGVGGRRPGPRRADRRAFGTRSASRSRPPARTTGPSPGRARRRAGRSWRAIPTCRRACRESPTRWGSTSGIASAAGRRFPGCPACSWARTTTSPGRSRT